MEENRVETLLNAIINGETIDFNPQSRMEEYLKNCINKTGVEGLPTPQSRMDALLYRLAETIASGGGGGNTGMTAKEWLRLRNGTRLFYNLTTIDEVTLTSLLSNIGNVLSDAEDMFYNCTNLPTVPLFDTSNVENMNKMFYGCKVLTEVPLLNTSKVTTMASMFYTCANLPTVPLFDTSNVKNMNKMFAGCKVLTEVPLFDTSNVEDMNSMFNGCTVLTEVPLFNTSKVTTMTGMFLAAAVQTIPAFNTSNVNNMETMFKQCETVTTIPYINTSKVTTMSYMFNLCTALKTIPSIDTSNVENMTYMFAKSGVEEIPSLDTSKVTNMSYMFNNCINLKTITSLDLRRVTNTTSMFTGCSACTDIRLKNIRYNLQVGSGTSYGHLLTVDSLINLIYELRNTGSSLTLTMGTANLAKLADVYVKTIEITDEMRAEDDLIDEKLPFVVCESTDEGATLITDYVLAKKWTLK